MGTAQAHPGHPQRPQPQHPPQQDIQPGDEVCISYLGTTPTKPNSLMLKDHGFVIPGNVNDRVPFVTGGSALCWRLVTSLGASRGEVMVQRKALATKVCTSNGVRYSLPASPLTTATTATPITNHNTNTSSKPHPPQAGSDVQSRLQGLAPITPVLNPAALSAAANAIGQGRVAADRAEGGRLQAALRSLAPLCRKDGSSSSSSGSSGGDEAAAGGQAGEAWVAAQREAVSGLLRQCAAMRSG